MTIRPRRRIITDLAADMAAAAERRRRNKAQEPPPDKFDHINTNAHTLTFQHIPYYPTLPAADLAELRMKIVRCYGFEGDAAYKILRSGGLVSLPCNHRNQEPLECICPCWCHCRQTGSCTATPTAQWTLNNKDGLQEKVFEILTPLKEWAIWHELRRPVNVRVRVATNGAGRPIKAFIAPHDTNAFRIVFAEPTVGCAFVSKGSRSKK